MRRYNEYTEQELIDLDKALIQKLIDYECALDGVPLMPPHPGPEPSKTEITPDMTVYAVAGLYFQSAEDAAIVLSAITSVSLFQTVGWHADDKRVAPISPGDYQYPKVQSEVVLSEGKFDSIKVKLERYTEAKSNWDKVSNLYDKGLRERKDIITRVNSVINTAKFNNNQKQEMRDKFEAYMGLADNNRTVAMNFLRKANPIWVDEYPDIVEELCPMYVEVSK